MYGGNNRGRGSLLHRRRSRGFKYLRLTFATVVRGVRLATLPDIYVRRMTDMSRFPLTGKITIGGIVYICPRIEVCHILRQVTIYLRRTLLFVFTIYHRSNPLFKRYLHEWSIPN